MKPQDEMIVKYIERDRRDAYFDAEKDLDFFLYVECAIYKSIAALECDAAIIYHAAMCKDCQVRFHQRWMN